MRLEYTTPEIDIIELPKDDIIVTSQFTDGRDQKEDDKIPGGEWEDLWG